MAQLLEQPLLNREKLAMKLGVSCDTVHHWTTQKRIPHFRMGHRTVRYSYPAVVSALGKFYQPTQATFSRKLPKRAPKYVREPKTCQLEFKLDSSQMTLGLD